MFLLPRDTYTVTTTKRKGRGVFATRDIAPGTIIGDYIGTLMRPEDENEKRDGLYTMGIGALYDVLASPKKEGIHLINHSCAANCGIYPYRGHILYIATRHIFDEEEITVNYMLGKAHDEKNTECSMHACHCGTKICTGTMHENDTAYAIWEALEKRESVPWQKKIPGKYGEELQPLETYSPAISLDDLMYQYPAFGSEQKRPMTFQETSLPSLAALSMQIRKTGRQLSFPKLHFAIYGIRHGMILGERTN
jgi:hypothetical protein